MAKHVLIVQRNAVQTAQIEKALHAMCFGTVTVHRAKTPTAGNVIVNDLAERKISLDLVIEDVSTAKGPSTPALHAKLAGRSRELHPDTRVVVLASAPQEQWLTSQNWADACIGNDVPAPLLNSFLSKHLGLSAAN